MFGRNIYFYIFINKLLVIIGYIFGRKSLISPKKGTSLRMYVFIPKHTVIIFYFPQTKIIVLKKIGT